MNKHRISSDSILTPGAAVLFQEVRGETVLLDLDAEQYYALNEPGSHIWKFLVEGQPVSGICEMMRMRYRVQDDEVEQHVHALLIELLDIGLVKLGSAIPDE